MRKRRNIRIAAAAVALAFVWLVFLRSPDEPTYQGKTVRELVWDYAKTNQQGFHPPPTVPIQQMGPRAVPLLVTELKRQNPATHKLQFRVWGAAPAWVRERMRNPYDVADAYIVRESAAITLGSLGSEARTAIPDLRVALSDSTPHVRLHAAFAIWQIDHALATEVVPILMELHTNAHNFKYYTALYFGRIGPDARAAIPLLQEALSDSNPNIRANAKRALRQVALGDSTN
jgi:hypothetical protein